MKNNEVTIQQIQEYFATYGFTVLRDIKYLSEDSWRHYFELLYPESDTVDDVVAEYTTEDEDDALKFFYQEAQEYVEENNIQPVPEEVEIDVDSESDEYVIYGLSLFLRDETLKEYPIRIVSREEIDGEEAQLVRFVFGKEEETCVAVVYDDGTIYTPQDWQTPVWDEDDWEIENSEWMDCNFSPCINFNGMPRRLM